MAYTGNIYTNRVGEIVADTSSRYYDKAENAGYPSGQCTWYCYGRTLERGLYSLTSGLGNAGQWFDAARSKGYITQSNPVSKSVAVFPGHVVFVEQYTGSTVYYTEANNPSVEDGQVSKLAWSKFKDKFGGCLGFIVVSKKPNPPTGD